MPRVFLVVGAGSKTHTQRGRHAFEKKSHVRACMYLRVFALASSVLGIVPVLLCFVNAAPFEGLFLLLMFACVGTHHAAALSSRITPSTMSWLEVVDSTASMCIVAYCTLEMSLNVRTIYRVALISALVGASCGYSVVVHVVPGHARRLLPRNLTIPFVVLCGAFLVMAKCTHRSWNRIDTFPFFTSLAIEGCIVVGAVWLQWGREYNDNFAHIGWHVALACCATAVVYSRQVKRNAQKKKCRIVSVKCDATDRRDPTSSDDSERP